MINPWNTKDPRNTDDLPDDWDGEYPENNDDDRS